MPGRGGPKKNKPKKSSATEVFERSVQTTARLLTELEALLDRHTDPGTGRLDWTQLPPNLVNNACQILRQAKESLIAEGQRRDLDVRAKEGSLAALSDEELARVLMRVSNQTRGARKDTHADDAPLRQRVVDRMRQGTKTAPVSGSDGGGN